MTIKVDDRKLYILRNRSFESAICSRSHPILSIRTPQNVPGIDGSGIPRQSNFGLGRLDTDDHSDSDESITVRFPDVNKHCGTDLPLLWKPQHSDLDSCSN